MLIRIRSHRARHALHDIVARKTDSFFSYYFRGEFHEVTPEEFARLREIKGLTQARLTDTQRAQLLQHWMD